MTKSPPRNRTPHSHAAPIIGVGKGNGVKNDQIASSHSKLTCRAHFRFEHGKGYAKPVHTLARAQTSPLGDHARSSGIGVGKGNGVENDQILALALALALARRASGPLPIRPPECPFVQNMYRSSGIGVGKGIGV
jgi:hypothetical protein